MVNRDSELVSRLSDLWTLLAVDSSPRQVGETAALDLAICVNHIEAHTRPSPWAPDLPLPGDPAKQAPIPKVVRIVISLKAIHFIMGKGKKKCEEECQMESF